MAEKQFVVFKLNQEEYALEILNVKEIVPYIEAIKIPNAPDYIQGIINLRGEIVPLMNLRIKFDMRTDSATDKARIIVINIKGRQIGFVVDEASEVLTISEECIDSSIGFISEAKSKYITGVGKINGRMILILCMDELFFEQAS